MKYFVASHLSENMHETPEGFLLCLGVPIARTGVMEYGEGETPLDSKNGKVLITREEKEVFRPETIASFEGKTVTINHPEEFVNPENWSTLAKGTLQNVRRGTGDEKNDLISDLLITDKDAINLVKKGLREVSCGYEAEYTQTEDGKGFQSNIIGNHLALVEQGRAGSSYKINDSKSKGDKMGLKEKVKEIFSKAQDEAMKVVSGDEAEEKKDDKKEAKSTDAYDELVKMVKDLGEKVSALGGKSKDDEKEPEEKEKKMKDDDKVDEKEKSEDDESSLEERLKALETAVSKLLEHESEEEVGDEDEMCEDEEEKEGSIVGDTASRAEILAPGIKQTKDVKAKALKTAYGTKEGKKIIDALTGGKAPTYDSAEKVDMLFVAASEVFKSQRSGELSETKKTKDSMDMTPKGPMTAEQMNKINEEYYKRN